MLIESGIIVIAAFIPAVFAAMGIYALIRQQTLLPLSLSPENTAIVLSGVLIMAAGSAFLSVGNLRRADPAEIF